MIWLLMAAVCLSIPVTASNVVAVTQVGNSVQLRLDDGYADILWLSHSAVRIRQAWQDQPPVRVPQRIDRIPVSVLDSPESVRIRSRDLVIVVGKQPFLLRFEEPDGELLLEQAAPVTREEGGVLQRFHLGDDERFSGLGPQSSRLDRRGSSVETTRPLLVSSVGYGVYVPGSRQCRFDLGRSDPRQLRILVRDGLRGDFVFYYGGSPAQVLDQHAESFGEVIEPVRAHAGVLAPIDKPAYALPVDGSWPDILRQTFQAGFSGIPILAVHAATVPGFASRFGGDLLAGLVPILLVPDGFEITPEAQRLRRVFESHRLTYLMEARDRGLPALHSMSYQFPFDPLAAPIEDQFFFGDEILVAPFLEPQNQRSVYLPQGIWTNWETNEVIRGRQTIRISTQRPILPMWARNGSIVPVNRRDLIELHYFPKLGGEYFLWEPEIDRITQVHAGPAADFLRLQIEEQIGRPYEWIVHNVIAPAAVSLGQEALQLDEWDAPLAARRWRYDENRRNLHIRLDAQAGDDLIVSVAFSAADWYLQ